MTQNRAKDVRILTTVLRGAYTASLDAPKYRRFFHLPWKTDAGTEDEGAAGRISCRSHRRGLRGFPEEAAHLASGGRGSCRTAWGALDLTPSNKLN